MLAEAAHAAGLVNRALEAGDEEAVARRLPEASWLGGFAVRGCEPQAPVRVTATRTAAASLPVRIAGLSMDLSPS